LFYALLTLGALTCLLAGILIGGTLALRLVIDYEIHLTSPQALPLEPSGDKMLSGKD